tara:strand:- start:2927 stop:3250 length:324 start_codon:yes stop_codon:yes gene_type:complete
MGFKYTKVTSYKWPVTVELPDNGQYKKETFTACFKKVGRKAFEDLDDEATEALMYEVLVGWEGITDEDNEDVPYSDEVKQDLLDDTYFVRGLMTSYLESLKGAPAKN